jgi:[methyl-Co(III) methanol-specific corrinoid protein]:coenzyme M methyltransferase
MAVLRGEPLLRRPVFSGLPSLTASGLRAAGVRYQSGHSSARLMAAAAASTNALFGFESAVVPFDLCVEAEALGCAVDFQTDVEAFLSPVIGRPLDWDDWQPAVSDDIVRAGRIPLVAEAVGILRRDVGGQVAIGAWVPGPFTLAWQLFGAEAWLGGLAEKQKATITLTALSEILGRVGRLYIAAGADFLTIHEMGGSPQVIGGNHFRTFVMPALVRLIASLPPPRVLSICGATNGVISEMAATGADALHVDQRNDLARTRQLLGPSAVLFGNFDPVETLSHGTPMDIMAAVRRIIAAGANAIWPGCDLFPDIPDINFRALMSAARAAVVGTAADLQQS